MSAGVARQKASCERPILLQLDLTPRKLGWRGQNCTKSDSDDRQVGNWHVNCQHSSLYLYLHIYSSSYDMKRTKRCQTTLPTTDNFNSRLKTRLFIISSSSSVNL